MPVYLIIEIRVIDQELYSRYVTAVFDIVTAHGGRYLIRGGKITPLTGDWQPDRIVIMEFDTIERMEACFQSPEYLKVAPLRKEGAISRAIAVEGYSPPA